MDLTPDACMDNHWADQKSLGKRDRDDADAPESNGQPAPARLPCGSYLEVAKASPTKPKDLNQLFLKEKGPHRQPLATPRRPRRPLRPQACS